MQSQCGKSSVSWQHIFPFINFLGDYFEVRIGLGFVFVCVYMIRHKSNETPLLIRPGKNEPRPAHWTCSLAVHNVIMSVSSVDFLLETTCTVSVPPLYTTYLKVHSLKLLTADLSTTMCSSVVLRCCSMFDAMSCNSIVLHSRKTCSISEITDVSVTLGWKGLQETKECKERSKTITGDVFPTSRTATCLFVHWFL